MRQPTPFAVIDQRSSIPTYFPIRRTIGVGTTSIITAYPIIKVGFGLLIEIALARSPALGYLLDGREAQCFAIHRAAAIDSTQSYRACSSTHSNRFIFDSSRRRQRFLG